jgi:hypothetical protein
MDMNVGEVALDSSQDDKVDELSDTLVDIMGVD